MPRISKPLTTEEIRAALPAGKLVRMADGLGLFLAITKQGSKIWRFRYFIDGKCQEIALGRWPELTLAKARKKRLEYRRMLMEGIDPADGRKQPE